MTRTLAVLIALLVGVAGWMVFEVRQAPNLVPAFDPPAPALPPIRDAAASRPPVLASVPADPEPGPGELAVCGAGNVKIDDQAAPWPPELADSERKAYDAMARLEDAADVRVRAAALYVAAKQPRAAGNADRAPLDRLAALAVHSSDPVVYWAAVEACGLPAGQMAAPGCMRLDLAQWARLEPRNAAPWLALADQARARQDAAGIAEAMHHAALAPLLDTRWGLVPALLLPALPPQTPPLERGMAAYGALGAQASAMVGGQAALGYCAEPALRDANLRQTCDAVASLLAERSSSLTDRRIGFVLGQRLGWPTARTDALQTEWEAAVVTAGRAVSMAAPLGCKSLRDAEQWFTAVGRQGEFQAALEVARGSGKPLAALAAEHRASTLRPAAEAAASAASAPP